MVWVENCNVVSDLFRFDLIDGVIVFMMIVFYV